MTDRTTRLGDLLRDWRGRRRFSQLTLAAAAGVSTRHLSFVESGRAAASRALLLRLAQALALPMREANALLLAGGFAPAHPARPLDATEMTAARLAVETVLKAAMPNPALLVDRHWTLLEANPAATALMSGIAPVLLGQPLNVLRASLHPQGLAPRIENLAEWRHHILGRLRVEAERSADPTLAALEAELRSYPAPASRRPPGPVNPVAVPLILRDPATGARLSLLSTTTVFGTATHMTLAELRLESFYPADEATRRTLSG